MNDITAVQPLVAQLTDEQLADEIRDQVNLSRNTARGHDRERTRALAAEAHRRGWNLRRPLKP